ncbi:chemotaxis protein MotC [Pseudaminobacter soli (ex Li et al. 2025)]|uniref:Chemotaxis protein MotC n=1 Tax=Pseudaminobacter soli (ex Li et al. 2025) TaxID=1295366 RepID=A0A2P7SDZ2_9HYPH|nr:chemotaxis protein MotC [Mesorhizobium soli]PSJ60698.1 chemotaxis protein MotC [Mesorhizobium soli]
MIRASRLSGFVGLTLLTGALQAPAHAESGTTLQPYQIVRSLQVVQDRIAIGDVAIMPMQHKLLEIMDGRLRKGSSQDFADQRNLRAMLVYAMSGGNPATISMLLSRLDLNGVDREIGKGLLHYLNGQAPEARVALASVDPMTLSPDLGAFVALVKGSVSAGDDQQGALKLLDQARLLGPGTLVEEGALRRSVALAATVGDADRFALASTQYAGRYLRSPYAPQFADAFVAGVVALHASLDLATVGAITAMMNPEQERIIYLRIARRAGIDGLTELSAFASAKAEDHGPSTETEDPRALLYSSLAAVPSGTSDEINAKLAKIDRRRLSQSDQELLDAVSDVAAKLTATPPALSPEASTQTEPEVVSADQEQPIAEANAAPVAPAKQNPALAPQAAPAVGSATAPAADDSANIVLETRRKLDEIDKLLGDVQ